MKSRLLLMGACVVGLYGCSTSKPATTQQNAVTVESFPPQPEQPVTIESAAGTSAAEPASATANADASASRDAVAERARRYAQQMEQAITESSRATAKTPEPEASKVDWAELFGEAKTPTAPADGATPPAAPEPAAPRPAIAAATSVSAPVDSRPTPLPAIPLRPAAVPVRGDTSTANAGISLDGQINDGPMVVPEGQEFAITEPAAPVTSSMASPSIAAPAAISEDVFAQRIGDNPRDVAAHLDYQLRQFTQGKSVPELTALSPLPVEDREVIAAVMDGLSNFRTSVQTDGNQLLSKKVRPLVDMSERLRAGADLAVPTIALCRKVDGFGVYDPIEPAQFARGREASVILYCEVANFSSQKADGKKWETTLSHSATLYRDSGVPVWSDKTTNVVDYSRNRRSDFFVVKMLRLPATLTTGRYVLKVTVVDRQSNRMAEGSLPITITDGSTPTGVATSE
ncbi:MAG TPA: hypothetical protein VGN72_18415 [Tepidisphaeraceae bacterium]|jgi:hypothetical protein|nr:hypothetical protein [Tepidisphaeraceae bacterium]